MKRVPLTLACGRYDRTWPLLDGSVEPEGASLTVIPLDPEECFWRMLRHEEFDAAEMSLASYAVARARGDERFVGIPVFLSRSFRHSSIYVRAGSGVETPKDLEGRRVGVPEYQITAAVWARGMLQHEHGVDLDRIEWRTGGLEEPGRVERQAIELPPRIRVEPLPDGDSLSAALSGGRIDALMAPRVPSAYRRDDRVRRLFDDPLAAEAGYYRDTGLFPIMHLVVARADVVERNPWLPESLHKAFDAAKAHALAGIAEAPALRYTMPFLAHALEHQREVFGEDPWPYGFAANRRTLEVFMGYLAEQGLVAEPPDPATLFAASTIAEHRV